MYKTGGRVWALARECAEDSKRWFPDSAVSIFHHTLGLCGEAGELANILKKIDRGDFKITDAAVKRMLVMELTDVFIYVLNIAAVMGIDLEESYKQKRAENEARFGNGKQQQRGA